MNTRLLSALANLFSHREFRIITNLSITLDEFIDLKRQHQNYATAMDDFGRILAPLIHQEEPSHAA